MNSYWRKFIPDLFFNLKSGFRLTGHNLRSVVSLGQREPSRRLFVYPKGGGWRISDGNDTLFVPSFRRWSRYRAGIQDRAYQLSRRYGHDIFYSLGAGDVVIDIGANIGEFTLAALNQGARVLAMEADAKVFRLLERNIRGREGVELLNVAAWCRDEVVTFYSEPINADSSIIEPSVYSAVVEVEGRTIATVMARAQVERLALLKCDAEGAEPEVLEGAVSMFPKIRWLAFECGAERQGQSTYEACAKLVLAHNFEVLEPPSGLRRMLIARNLSPDYV